MKRLILAALLGLAVAPIAFAQSDNMIHVKSFPGVDVGSKVTAAMANCNPTTAGPCMLVIDATLAAWAPGTMPTLCAWCSLLDYRSGISPALIGAGSGNPPPYTYINMWGDSLTYGNQDGSGITLCTVINGLSGLPCNNYGISGETSTAIAARMGALATSVILSGNQIPASGPVTITSWSPAINVPANGTTAATISGVSGSTVCTGTSCVFTRTVAGSIVGVSGAGVAWTPNIVPLAGSLNIIFACTNDLNPPQPCISDMQAMVAASVAANASYLVIGPLNRDYPGDVAPAGAGYQTTVLIQQTLGGLFPNNFIDLREQLVSQYNPNSQADITSYIHDTAPPSIRANYNLGTLSATITSASCAFTSTAPTLIVSANTVIFGDTGEQVLLITAAGGVASACIRGYNGTTAAAHTAGAAMTGIDGLHLGGATGYTYAGALIDQWIVAHPANSAALAQVSTTAAASGTVRNSTGSSFLSGVQNRGYALATDLNFFQGSNTFGTNQTGVQNVGVGATVAFNCTSCSYNTFLGQGVAGYMVSGNFNTCVGWGDCYDLLTSDETALGASVLVNDTCGANTGVGYSALHTNSTGCQNTATGYEALQTVNQGSDTCTGYRCGYAATTSFDLTGNGDLALGQITTGNDNTADGFEAGYNSSTPTTTTSQGVYLGSKANDNANGYSGNIVIGYGAQGTATHQTNIGVAATTQAMIWGIESHPSQTAIASASTIAPTSQMFHVTGTTAIVTITAPLACTQIAVTMCQLTIIPDGIWTTTAAGNIAIASTAVVSKALLMTYDPGTSKWYPSY
jgi:hypothetical protein